jgi:tetratricopeptide (TPR) repeat protein
VRRPLSLRTTAAALAIACGLSACAPEPPLDRASLALLHQKAAAAQNAGDYETAERLHREVVQRMDPQAPGEERALQLVNLSSVLNLRDQPDAAENVLREADALLAGVPDVSPQLRAALHLNRGKSRALQRQWTEAEREYRAGIALLSAMRPRNDLLSFTADANLAFVYWRTGRLMEAQQLYEASLEYFLRAAASDHPVVRQFETEYQQLLREMSPAPAAPPARP